MRPKSPTCKNPFFCQPSFCHFFVPVVSFCKTPFSATHLSALTPCNSSLTNAHSFDQELGGFCAHLKSWLDSVSLPVMEQTDSLDELLICRLDLGRKIIE